MKFIEKLPSILKSWDGILSRKWTRIGFSTVLLLFVALYNGYPLMTSDSGAYMNNAFHFGIPQDRPLTYSLFIRVILRWRTLWLVILAQSFWLSCFLVWMIDDLVPSSPKARLFLILLVSVFTGATWYVSQIMPDIFSALMFLASIQYLLSKSTPGRRVGLATFFLCLLMHHSNLITGLILTIFLVLFSFLKTYQAFRKKALYLFVTTVFSWILMCSFHAVNGYGFRPSRSTHVFLIAKMSENGILKTYLEDHCAKDTLSLCAYKDVLPKHAWDFIWADHGVLTSTGGWDSSKEEYSRILMNSITQKKYLGLHLRESAKATWEQVRLSEVGDGIWPYLDGTNPYWKVDEFFHGSLNRYKHSLQSRNELKYGFINQVYRYFILLSTLIALLLWIFYRKIARKIVYVFLLSILFIVLNAFVTATFANILARLNSRVLWILPVMNLIVIFNILFNLQKLRTRKGQ